MRKAEKYRVHAAQCRAMARRADDKHKHQLLKMAETWDSLAVNREIQIARQERIAALEEKISAAEKID